MKRSLMLLAILIGAAAGADMRQMGPNDDLPFCRVVENDAASIDRDPPVYRSFDGWWCAETLQLFPLSANGQQFGSAPLYAGRIVKVTQAKAQPGRMPAEWRRQVNDYIAKNHVQAPVPASANAANGQSKP